MVVFEKKSVVGFLGRYSAGWICRVRTEGR